MDEKWSGRHPIWGENMVEEDKPLEDFSGCVVRKEGAAETLENLVFSSKKFLEARFKDLGLSEVHASNL